jgi:hypothetical protein
MENLQYDFPEISENEQFSLFEKLKSEETKELNFDQYRNKVYKSLSDIEGEIISNLAQHDNEFIQMFRNFDEADVILNKLESSLLTFKDKLSDINQDMKVLQNKSSEISIKLKNRKEFEEELFKLLDSIILAPDFLNDITNKEIDDDFVEKIKKLDEKLYIFKGGELPESNAIEEIIPEMRKTLAKVCSKIYTFVLNNFMSLNRTGTNIQMIQKHVFLKYKALIVFIKKHAVTMFNELVNKYVSLMEKIYYNSAVKYCQELNKLIYDKHDKFSLISAEELNKDLFLIINKRKSDALRDMEKESIVPVIAQKNKETLYYEQIFQSLNKFLMDLITWEVLFFNDFFDLGILLSKDYLDIIYKNSVNTIFENINKNLLGIKNCDFFALSLMIITNFEHRRLMENRKLNHLDVYFGNVERILWPRFDSIFKMYIDSIFKVNVKNTKLLINGIHTVTHKLGEFLSMINLICKQTTNTPMLLSKIRQIQKNFNQFFYELTESYKFSNNYEREEMVTVFFINNLHHLLIKLSDFEAIITSEDPDSFDKIFNNKRESYLNILFKKYFEELNRVLQVCIAKGDVNETIRDTTRENNKGLFDLSEINFNLVEVEKLSKNDLKAIAQFFNAKYREVFETAKKEVGLAIKDPENAKIIFKKFLNEVVIR